MPLPNFAPREPREPNRGTTALELLFDLAAVVAIGAVAGGLALNIADQHVVDGLIAFLCSFFMVWWAWMNYTWFASAYDDGSSLFRALSMVMMLGALILAAGVDAVFRQEPIWLALFGFVVMRLPLVALWLGAARGDPARRATALRYAGGIFAMQLYWIGLVVLVAPAASLYLPLFLLGAIGELAVPAVAERAGATPWHRQHIVARYGRLTLIVLAQCFVAVVAAIELAPGAAFPDIGQLSLALLFAIVAFSMWSLYFTDEAHFAGGALRHALLWGYGHFVILGAAAAAGAGMRVVLATDAVSLAVAAPVAVYCAMLWLVRDRVTINGPRRWALPAAAVLMVLIGTATPFGLALVALVLAVTAVVRRKSRCGSDK